MNTADVLQSDIIGCHALDPQYAGHPVIWRPGFLLGPEPPLQPYCGGRHYGPFQTFRTCSYCGSMHPADLVAALKAGATLSGCTWKYGWPHKFYVENIRNPYPDVPIVTAHRGATGGAGLSCEAPHPAGPTLWGKWYNKHLTDLEGTDLFVELTALLEEKARIRFCYTPERRLAYEAPHHGYEHVPERAPEPVPETSMAWVHTPEEELDGTWVPPIPPAAR